MLNSCPDPAALTFWRDTMSRAGIGLLVAVGLVAVVVWAARPSGWPLRLASGLSVALALGAAVASFLLFTRLNDVFAQLTSWFPDYPQDCIPLGHGGPFHITALQAMAQQAASSAERAAAIDLAVALVALAALVVCAAQGIRAARRRDMTTVILGA